MCNCVSTSSRSIMARRSQVPLKAVTQTQQQLSYRAMQYDHTSIFNANFLRLIYYLFRSRTQGSASSFLFRLACSTSACLYSGADLVDRSCRLVLMHARRDARLPTATHVHAKNPSTCLKNTLGSEGFSRSAFSVSLQDAESLSVRTVGPRCEVRGAHVRRQHRRIIVARGRTYVSVS